MSAEYTNLETLFRGRTFVIPDYQRGYSWGEGQIEDLKKDIEIIQKRKDNNTYSTGAIVAVEGDKESGKDNNTHFTGAIVAVEGNDGYEVVDGQQRLTTLLILIQSICQSEPEKYADITKQYIQTGGIGNEKLKFIPNSEVKVFFKEYIINNHEAAKEKTEYLSHEKIVAAKENFDKWIKEKEKDKDKILDIVTKQLKFIFFNPSDSAAGMMFEVINNRGKPLSELEKIKNYLLYLSINQNKASLRVTINETWTKILKNLNKAYVRSLDDENNFLRYCYLVFFDDSTKKSQHVYRELKNLFSATEELVDEKIEKLQKFLCFLEEASMQYAYFHNSDYFKAQSSSQKGLLTILKYLRCHPVNASIMPLYLAIMCKSPSDNNEKLKLLELLEVLNFRVYVLPKVTARADSSQPILFKWGHDYFHGKEKFKWHGENTELQFKEALSTFIKRHCDTITFIKHLTIDEDESENYYNWKGLKYFLGRYEEKLQNDDKNTWDVEQVRKLRTECQSGDYISTEHIWAVGNNNEHYPTDYIQKRRLGNFVIISLRANIHLGDDDIATKVKSLKEGQSTAKLKQVYELEKFCANSEQKSYRKRKTHAYHKDLSSRINDERETKLIQFALETWKIDADQDIFDKVDSFHGNKDGKNYFIKTTEA